MNKTDDLVLNYKWNELMFLVLKLAVKSQTLRYVWKLRKCEKIEGMCYRSAIADFDLVEVAFEIRRVVGEALRFGDPNDVVPSEGAASAVTG